MRRRYGVRWRALIPRQRLSRGSILTSRTVKRVRRDLTFKLSGVLAADHGSQRPAISGCSRPSGSESPDLELDIPLRGSRRNRRHLEVGTSKMSPQRAMRRFETSDSAGALRAPPPRADHPLLPGETARRDVLRRDRSCPRVDLPQFVKNEFDTSLECGILAAGFLRVTARSKPHCPRTTRIRPHLRVPRPSSARA